MNTFLTKLILNGIIVIPFLLVFSNANGIEATVAAAIFCVIAYLVGDQLILRRTNNTVATIADIALAYLYFLVVGIALGWTLSNLELLSLSLAIGLVELFFHFIVASRMKEVA
jgi:uncharacterized protein YacL